MNTNERLSEMSMKTERSQELNDKMRSVSDEEYHVRLRSDIEHDEDYTMQI